VRLTITGGAAVTLDAMLWAAGEGLSIMHANG